MTFASRAAVTAAFALALTGPALAAHASGNDWKTLSTTAGGKLQACKIATTATGPWKIKLRVDATQASTSVSGRAWVLKGDANTDQTWKSGWVAKGHVSDVGTVRLPRGAEYTLNAGIGTHDMGNGGSFRPGAIRAC
jgi:hypothetical protein